MFNAGLSQDECLNVSKLEPAVGKPAFEFNITACANASGKHCARLLYERGARC